MNRQKTRERNAAVVRRASAGERVAELAQEFDITVGYIYTLVRKGGCHLPDKRVGRPAAASQRVARRRAAMAELHCMGISSGDTRRLLKLSRNLFYIEARLCGLKFPYDGSRWATGVRPSQQRAAKMAALYRSGMTLQQIGQKYGITRERVRQLMTKHEGMTHTGGGQHIKSVAKRQQATAERDAKYMAKYGCTFAQYQEVRQIGRDMVAAGGGLFQTPLRAFASQRQNAKTRGIGWSLTFWQWWTLWSESGKWAERGKRRDGFVMSRFMDQGEYRLGNVYIGTLAENSSVQPNNPYRKDHPDHARVMPAVSEKLSKAMRGREGKGLRVASKRKRDKSLPLGVRSNGVGKFIAAASFNGKSTYLGTHETPALAHAAYLRAVEEHVNSAHKISEAA